MRRYKSPYLRDLYGPKKGVAPDPVCDTPGCGGFGAYGARSRKFCSDCWALSPEGVAFSLARQAEANAGIDDDGDQS
ncbi:MAG: hypothetical protein A3E78_11995 [Alphaproteobacteria bacterium RIFCSPHIGHO2_12_FULL_63_12]|nr:MAG: hypothetical protein A3E78_11995 [Alphaproteobacteria bacterium RIFCSPHIGHO2_12_FULL_63_12]